MFKVNNKDTRTTPGAGKCRLGWLVEMINICVHSNSKLIETQKLLLMNHVLININQMYTDNQIAIDKSWKKSMPLSDFERVRAEFSHIDKNNQ